MGQDHGTTAHRSGHPAGGEFPRFDVAFQPIVDVGAGRIVAHEALLRGLGGTPADGVLARVPPARRVAFEAEAVATILSHFATAGAEYDLHVNVSPAVLLRAPGMPATVADLVEGSALAPSRVVIEVTEGERIDDSTALARVVTKARERGLRIALDDFGTGYGGIGLLDEVRPDLVKLDMSLVRGINHHRIRRPTVSRILDAAGRLGIGVVAVGIETEGEFHCLTELGVTLVQGFLVAPPARERLVQSDEIVLPVRRSVPAWLAAPSDFDDVLRRH